jgi:hypothetical protein
MPKVEAIGYNHSTSPIVPFTQNMGYDIMLLVKNHPFLLFPLKGLAQARLFLFRELLPRFAAEQRGSHSSP